MIIIFHIDYNFFGYSSYEFYINIYYIFLLLNDAFDYYDLLFIFNIIALKISYYLILYFFYFYNILLFS